MSGMFIFCSGIMFGVILTVVLAVIYIDKMDE